MKHLMLAVALIGSVASVSAFAQDVGTTQPSNATVQLTSNDTQWVPPYGQPVAEKTRAQVYQELVQAKGDGQLAYLDSTIYAHH
jgi:Domain of unknown function (DUF4148)